jgi:hypothetical protein
MLALLSKSLRFSLPHHPPEKSNFAKPSAKVVCPVVLADGA